MTKSDARIWELNELGAVADFDKMLAEIETNIEVVEKWWTKLSPTMGEKEFGEFLEYDEELDVKFSKLVYLPELMEAINQKDSQARLMKTKADNLILKFNQTSRKIGHWLKGLAVEGKKVLDDDNANRLFKVVPDLEYGLSYARTAAKHTLPMREEEIIENKDVSGIGVVSDLRSLIETDMVYQMGQKKIRNQAELLKHVHSRSGKQRESAYRALFTEHKKQIEKLFAIYQGIVRDWGYEARIRGYKSPIAMRNFGNHMSDEVVETLLEVCQEERKIFWRYFQYKARMLRKPRLNRFDLYAPVGNRIDRKIDFESARQMVLNSFERFCPRFASEAKKVLDRGHVDSHPGKNKRSGAFCATVSPKIAPYVLLNHTNTQRDVSTLAHELGHAIHSLYASHHSPSAQHANLPLSETASTLAELILFEEMLSGEPNNEIKRQMLVEKIGDSYATILRQNYFVIFEKKAHELIAKGTTAEELSKLYLDNLREQFGRAVVVEPIFKYEWLYISHIFESPFYCYAYNFGELLALSLYAKYKKTGREFVPKIEELLAVGGSMDPMKALVRIGVKVDDPEFWREGLGIILGWQKRLEEL